MNRSECKNCIYKFSEIPLCIMNSKPENCVWNFYNRKLRNKNKTDDLKFQNEKINGCINMLLKVAEKKYGDEYAEKLRKEFINENQNGIL